MANRNYKMEIWGAIYALLSQRTPITPTAMGNITSLPGEQFGRLNALALPRMSDADVARMAELVSGLTPSDITAGPVPLADQSLFWLSFYKAGGVSGGTDAKTRAGRPIGGNGIDWSDVDWTLSNAEIARGKDCSPETVRSRRAKIETNGDAGKE